MANQEQLDILRQGIEVWNNWREKYFMFDLEIDLTNAHLRRSNLCSMNLSNVNLSRANLIESDLSKANLSFANLKEVDIWGANLKETVLIGTNFVQADLNGADLSNANLIGADLREANLCGVDLDKAMIGNTILNGIDLSEAVDLEGAIHRVPSYIDTQSLRRSKGRIPETFLRGCGLTDWEIESARLYNPDLTNEEIVKIQYRMFNLRATQALQISPLFISYSHVDTAFVDRLDTSLIQKGVRFWRDIHDAKAGRLETQIDRAIRQNPTVLLILSKNSIKSDWVEHEVRKARELEKELGRDALCPVALDDGWKSSPWPKRVMEQVMEYNILDFSGWQDKSTFDSKFAKLLSGLAIFYKKPAT